MLVILVVGLFLQLCIGKRVSLALYQRYTLEMPKRFVIYFGFVICAYIETEASPNGHHTLFGNKNVTQTEQCYRPCIDGELRVCHFKFVMEYYHAMGP